MNDFIDKRKKVLESFKKDYRGKLSASSQVEIPKDMFTKCEGCSELLLKDDLIKNDYVCFKCSYHFRLNAKKRLTLIDTNNTFIELDQDLALVDPLTFLDI